MQGGESTIEKMFTREFSTEPRARLVAKPAGAAELEKADGYIEERLIPVNSGRVVDCVFVTKKEDTTKREDLTTLVGFNGLMGSPEPFIRLMRVLGVENYRMISIYPPGHGDTSSPRGVTFAEWMVDVKELLEKEGARNVILLGSSFGAAEALHLSKMSGDRVMGLVLDNPLISRLDVKKLIKFAPRWIADVLSAMPKAPASIRRMQKDFGFDFPLKSIRRDEIGNVVKFLGTIEEGKLSSITTPTVLFYGRRDYVLRTRENLTRFRGIRTPAGELKLEPDSIIRVTEGNPIVMGQPGGHNWGLASQENFYSAMSSAVRLLREKWMAVGKTPVAPPEIIQPKVVLAAPEESKA